MRTNEKDEYTLEFDLNSGIFTCAGVRKMRQFLKLTADNITVERIYLDKQKQKRIYHIFYTRLLAHL